MFHQLAKDQSGCVIVDSGNLIDDAKKLDLIAAVMSQLKYDAVGLSVNDLLFGSDVYRAFGDAKLPLLFAGVEANQFTVPFIVKDVRGVRVGVVSFGGVLLNLETGGDLVLRKSLYSAFAAARRACDILILLDESCIASPEWVERNRRRLGSPDIIIGGLARTVLASPHICGDATYVMPSSMQARSVGVIDIEYTAGAPLKLDAQLVKLDGNVLENPSVAARVSDLMSKLSADHLASAEAEIDLARTNQPYYSSTVCRGCHADEHADWKATPHASAVNHLIKMDRAVPECLTCHSEVYRRTQNVQTALRAKSGVECASCHMDSLPHGADHVFATTRAKVNPTICLHCHTKDRSPAYDEKPYLSKVSHIRATDNEAVAE